MSFEEESKERDVFAGVSYVITYILWMTLFFQHYDGVVSFVGYALASVYLSFFSFWLVMVALGLLCVPINAAAEAVRKMCERK